MKRAFITRILAAGSIAAGLHAQTTRPDLARVWRGTPSGQVSFSKTQLPMRPKAEHDYKYNTVDARNPGSPGRKELDPHIVYCAPPGVPRLWLMDGPFEIIQTKEQIVIFYEED